jgi:hypothetical protein
LIFLGSLGLKLQADLGSLGLKLQADLGSLGLKPQACEEIKAAFVSAHRAVARAAVSAPYGALRNAPVRL